MQLMEKIDDTSNLKDAPVVIFSGTNDQVIFSTLQRGQELFYDNYESNILYLENDFGHNWPADISTDELPSISCNSFGFPVANCGYDAAGMILNHTLPNITGSTVTSLNERDTDWWS
jgi:hypothetical protein